MKHRLALSILFSLLFIHPSIAEDPSPQQLRSTTKFSPDGATVAEKPSLPHSLVEHKLFEIDLEFALMKYKDARMEIFDLQRKLDHIPPDEKNQNEVRALADRCDMLRARAAQYRQDALDLEKHHNETSLAKAAK